MSISRDAVLATVERSPAAAADHDRAGWVGLFTGTARIEDPVGSRPHIGTAEIERFYDTFIGPRDITFHRDVDIVAGHTVLRDLVLEVAMGPAVTMHIPAVLRYDVQPSGIQPSGIQPSGIQPSDPGDLTGGLSVARLQAFWELPAMVGRFARNGPSALPAGVALTRALLRNQGPAGAAGFLSGLAGVGARGKQCVAQLIDDACAGDEMTVKRRLGPDVDITAGDNDRIRPTELVAALAGTQRRTVLAAGRHVVVTAVGAASAAVVIADVASRPARVQRLRLFTEGA